MYIFIFFDRFMAYENLIFDFDGTIADTYAWGMKIANKILKDKGYDPNKIQLSSIYNMKFRQVLRKFKWNTFVVPNMIRATQKELFEVMHKVSSVKDLKPILRDLAKKKKTFYCYI